MKPSTYTPAIGHLICSQIADGSSLRSVCETDGIPDKKTVWSWLQANPEFKQLYDAARIERAHAYAEEIVDIADDGSNDWMENNDPDNPGYKFNGEHAQRSKLRLEARKWICAKMLPKLYGDKLAVGGADDLPPLKNVQRIELVDLTAGSKS